MQMLVCHHTEQLHQPVAYAAVSSAFTFSPEVTFD